MGWYICWLVILLEAVLPGVVLVWVPRSLWVDGVAGPLVPVARLLVACWLPGMSVGRVIPAPGGPALVGLGECSL